MFLKSLVVSIFLLSGAAASASPCADHLTDSLTIGDHNLPIEEAAKHAAAEHLEDIPLLFNQGAHIRVGVNLDPSQGLYIVDTKLDWDTVSYYVHVAEMGPAKVERIVQMSAESEKALKKIARKSMDEWLARHNYTLPGFWTGGPPRIEKAAIEKVFTTAHNSALVIFRITAAHVTPAPVVLYSAMEIREGKVQLLSQPQFLTPELSAEEEEYKALQKEIAALVRKQSAFSLPAEIKVMKIDVRRTTRTSKKSQFEAAVFWRFPGSQVGWKSTYFVETAEGADTIVQWRRSEKI